MFVAPSGQINKKINTEQIEQIVKAIISGKYSWACVLLLRYSGHNPIEYIPYRTYIRLLKNNCLLAGSQQNQTAKKDMEVFNIKSNWIHF
ncbi:HetP family heterocyst commitment protein [Anabaena catenula]|uniref:HetP family heterocyst commitment protein n=1 Tax=Anabaena catenula FACHB-362 TaxID=2692877 RepID=A0ABR8IYK1_9NOST|nr:HetP family heterocyst commitment protein [Anabaena catenula]MBD2691163.1 HetP family heterocyst commitment protein [Anabaena catenula FACHB-362]